MRCSSKVDGEDKGREGKDSIKKSCGQLWTPKWMLKRA